MQTPGEGGDIDLGTVFPTKGRRLNDKRLAGSFEKGCCKVSKLRIARRAARACPSCHCVRAA